MKNTTLAGAILRMERTRQGLMLKQVCHGVCVTSYLSKIEHGSAQADPAMLSALFARLGIVYTEDEALLAPLREKLAAYHEAYLYCMDMHDIFRELMTHDMLMMYSPLCVDWLIVRGLEGQDVLAHLDLLEDCLTSRQRAWRDLLKGMQEPSSPRSLVLLEEAAAVLGDSSSLLEVCIAAFFQAEYALIHRLESRITALALEEGNTYILGCYYDYKGMAYACLEQEDMMMDCYRRAIHLLEGTRWRDRVPAMCYNIGATCITLGKYDEAMKYLAQSEERGESLALRHKQALACIRAGRMEAAKPYLVRMKALLDEAESPAQGELLWYEEALAECREGFLEDPEYLALLERLLAAVRREAHFGYLYFYREVYTKACTRQRQYKRALEFEREVSSVMGKNGV